MFGLVHRIYPRVSHRLYGSDANGKKVEVQWQRFSNDQLQCPVTGNPDGNFAFATHWVVMTFAWQVSERLYIKHPRTRLSPQKFKPTPAAWTAGAGRNSISSREDRLPISPLSTTSFATTTAGRGTLSPRGKAAFLDGTARLPGFRALYSGRRLGGHLTAGLRGLLLV